MFWNFKLSQLSQFATPIYVKLWAENFIVQIAQNAIDSTPVYTYKRKYLCKRKRWIFFLVSSFKRKYIGFYQFYIKFPKS